MDAAPMPLADLPNAWVLQLAREAPRAMISLCTDTGRMVAATAPTLRVTRGALPPGVRQAAPETLGPALLRAPKQGVAREWEREGCWVQHRPRRSTPAFQRLLSGCGRQDVRLTLFGEEQRLAYELRQVREQARCVGWVTLTMPNWQWHSAARRGLAGPESFPEPFPDWRALYGEDGGYAQHLAGLMDELTHLANARVLTVRVVRADRDFDRNSSGVPELLAALRHLPPHVEALDVHWVTGDDAPAEEWARLIQRYPPPAPTRSRLRLLMLRALHTPVTYVDGDVYQGYALGEIDRIDVRFPRERAAVDALVAAVRPHLPPDAHVETEWTQCNAYYYEE